MTARAIKLLAAAALGFLAFGAVAQQQQPAAPKPQPAAKAPAAKADAGRDAFKGKVKPGLYDVTTEVDLGNTPGVPKEHVKQTQKRQQCITQQEVDQGVEKDPNCPITSYASAGNRLSISASCRDGATTETRMTFNPTGYTVEMKANSKHEGKPVTSTFKVTSRYVGPCPTKMP